jgi:hypothetical protein
MSIPDNTSSLHPHLILGPLFWAWFRARSQDEGEWRYPTGPCGISIPGPHALRILIIGDGPAAGCGVRIHELGIAGHLARHVARQTSRGVSVTVAADRAASAHSTLRRLDDFDLAGYDAVVLMLAATDAFCLTPRHSWRRDMAALVHSLRSRTSARVVVTGIATLELARSLTPLARRLTGNHARILDGETRRICAETATEMISLDAASDLTSRTYAMWARRIGSHLVDATGERRAPMSADRRGR